MLHAYAEKNAPYVLSPESLDWYLNKGWYRMGASIFTTNFLFFGGQPYSAVWIRQDLGDFTFSRSQRRLLRRNAKQFTVAWGPRVIDGERNELYDRYAADFDGFLSPSIQDSLEDYDQTAHLFDTWEITVRDRVSNQLVAVSYFDLGQDSAASILGIYDPLLKSFSLGYYTMLLEMNYCLEHGLRFYYPGYVVPGYGRFDYKLRIGPTDYLDLRDGSWRPWDAATVAAEGPVEIQAARLTDLVARLRPEVERPADFVLIYPLFEAELYDASTAGHLPYPYFYAVGRDETDHVVLVVFDPRDREYLMLRCVHHPNSGHRYPNGRAEGPQADRIFGDLLTFVNVLFRSANPNVMATACLHLLQDAP